MQDLESEYQKGQDRLAALEKEAGNLQSTMLRISGAIQVLRELIGEKEIEPYEKRSDGIEQKKAAVDTPV